MCEDYGFQSWKANMFVSFETKVPFRSQMNAVIAPDGCYIAMVGGREPGTPIRGLQLGELGPMMEWSGRLERHLLEQGLPLTYGTGTRSLAISPDGLWLIVSQTIEGASRTSETVRIFSVDTGRYLRELESAEAAIRHVEVSRDGTFILSAGDTAVFIWDFATGKIHQVLREAYQAAALQRKEDKDQEQDQDQDQDQGQSKVLSRVPRRGQSTWQAFQRHQRTATSEECTAVAQD